MRWLAVSDGLVRTCLAKGSNYCHYYNERPLKVFQTRALLKILYWAIVNKTEVFLFSLQTYEELSTPQHPAFLPSNVMLPGYANAVTEEDAMRSASSCSLQSQSHRKRQSPLSHVQSTKPPVIPHHVGQFRLVKVLFLVRVRTAHNVCSSAFCHTAHSIPSVYLTKAVSSLWEELFILIRISYIPLALVTLPHSTP